MILIYFIVLLGKWTRSSLNLAQRASEEWGGPEKGGGASLKLKGLKGFRLFISVMQVCHSRGVQDMSFKCKRSWNRTHSSNISQNNGKDTCEKWKQVKKKKTQQANVVMTELHEPFASASPVPDTANKSWHYFLFKRYSTKAVQPPRCMHLCPEGWPELCFLVLRLKLVPSCLDVLILVLSLITPVWGVSGWVHF